jgi:hypothetical protein
MPALQKENEVEALGTYFHALAGALRVENSRVS